MKSSLEVRDLDGKSSFSGQLYCKGAMRPRVALIRRRHCSNYVKAPLYQDGCALFQTTPEGERRPIGHRFRALNIQERNYPVSEGKCLAVVWFLATLTFYLMDIPFLVYMDHSSLRCLMIVFELSGCLMRWQLCLAEFDFTLTYKEGVQSTHADALSRLLIMGA